MTRRFGADHDVLSVSSPPEAVQLQERLARDQRLVALTIAYQWMPEMTGIDLQSISRTVTTLGFRGESVGETLLREHRGRHNSSEPTWRYQRLGALGTVNACVVGAGNSAGQLATYLSQVGAKVTLSV